MHFLQLYFTALLFVISFTFAEAEVSISNQPNNNVSWDAAGQKYDIFASPANINIPDLINHLMTGSVTIDDGIYSMMPFQCVGTHGPIIVVDPVIYTSDFNINLISTYGIYVYNIIENSGQGNISFNVSECTGVEPGDIVIGTGIHNLDELPFTDFMGAPSPPASTNVHIGLLGGMFNANASNTFCVVADTITNAYAQLGFPSTVATSSINIFPANGLLVHAEDYDQSYARIGHGSNGLVAPLSGNIIIGTEVGNMYILAGDPITADAAIGHVSAAGITGFIEAYILDTSPPPITQGNVKIIAGAQGEARLGHYSDLMNSDAMVGNITLSADGIIEIFSGSNSAAYAKVGHFWRSDGILSGNIVMESKKATIIYADLGMGNAGVGHRATQITSGEIKISADSFHIQADGNSSARIGHKRQLPLPLPFNGDILLLSNALNMNAGFQQGGYTQIGHEDEFLTGSLNGNVEIYVSSVLSMLAGTSDNTSSRIAHSGMDNPGEMSITVGNDFYTQSGTSSLNSDVEVAADSNLVIQVHDSIVATALADDIVFKSRHASVEINTGKDIILSNSSTPNLARIEAVQDIIVKSGDDIGLSQLSMTTDTMVSLIADHYFPQGELWQTIPIFGNNLGLFFNTVFNSPSAEIVADQLGTYRPLDNQTMYINTMDCQLHFSQFKAETGIESEILLGPTDDIDPTGVSGYLEIGSRAASPSQAIAYEQTGSKVVFENLIINLDSLFVIANDSLRFTDASITTDGPIILVSDNAAPSPGTMESGVFTSSNSTFQTNGSKGIDTYSASPQQNKNAGNHPGTTFNGNSYPSCQTPCSEGIWLSWYPDTPRAGTAEVNHHFKTDTILLAIKHVPSFYCTPTGLQLSIFGAEFSMGKYIIEGSPSGKKWSVLASLHSETSLVDYKHIYGFSYFRIRNLGNGEKSHIFRIPCIESYMKCSYPNPVEDILDLHCRKVPATIAIYNLSGKKLITVDNSTVVDVSQLPPGMYFVSINGFIQKIVKQ